MQLFEAEVLFTDRCDSAQAWAVRLAATMRQTVADTTVDQRAARVARVAKRGGLITGLLALGACSSSDDLVDGVVTDDPVAFATVFNDENNNGVLDAGEPNTTTNTDGKYRLADLPADPDAQVVATGGIDQSTGLPLNGVLVAPPNSATVSPLTTLLHLSGGSVNDQVGLKAALGIGAGVSLTNYNPDQALDNNPNDARALEFVTVQRMAAVLAQAVETTAGVDSLAAYQAIADVLAGTTGSSLSDVALINDVLAEAGVADAALRDAAAQAIANVNAEIESHQDDALSSDAISAVVLAQALLPSELAKAAADPTDGQLRELSARLSEEGIDEALAAADLTPTETGETDVAAATDFVEVNRNAEITFAAADLAANDLDLTGGDLTVTGASDDSAGIDVAFDAATGEVTVNAVDGFVGLTTFEYSVESSNGGTATGTVAVRVRDPRFTTEDSADGERLDGTADVDVLAGGGNGDDVLSGRGESDVLFSVIGNDGLLGGADGDALVATNSDGSTVAMIGGSGGDDFVLAALDDDSGLDVDVLVGDFAPDEDRLDVSRLRNADGSEMSLDDVLGRASADGNNTVVDLSGLMTDGGQTAEASVQLLLIQPDQLTADNVLVAAGGPSPSDVLGDLLTSVD